jgi:hypothetical protein
MRSTLDNTIIQSIAFGCVDRSRPKKKYGDAIRESAHRRLPSLGRASGILGGFRGMEAAGPMKIVPAGAMPAFPVLESVDDVQDVH